jgi:DNA-binding CsgD family transcriptional regulator
VAILGNYHLGTASIVYAAEHQETVSHLVLWHAYRTLDDVAGNSLFGATRSLVSQDWQLFTEMLASVVMGWETGEAARRFAGQIREALDRETLLAIMKATTSYDVREYLPRLSMPTLVMHRRDCRRHPVEIARKLAAEISGARLVLVDGNAMLYYLGEQSRVLDPLLAFLNEGGGGGEEPRVEASAAANTPRLSTRESEVAVLVALGCTNRDIAERLVISEHTANLHVKHILAKLGFRSRAQIAAWISTSGAAGRRSRRSPAPNSPIG